MKTDVDEDEEDDEEDDEDDKSETGKKKKGKVVEISHYRGGQIPRSAL